MQQWEYTETTAALEGRNKFGKEGWELVCATMRGTVQFYHFKRSLQNKDEFDKMIDGITQPAREGIH